MSDLLPRLLDEPTWLVYLVVFGVVLLEDAVFVGFLLPGETVAILGGVSSSLGHTSLGWMLTGVVLAAVIGDGIGYEVGRAWGSKILEARILDTRRHRLEAAREALRERGGGAVFLGRWTAFFRAVMPALAGASGMPYRRFLPWNAIGGLTWGCAVVLGGYAAGMSYRTLERWLGGGAALAVAVVVVVATVAVVWHVRRRRAATR